MRRFIFIGFLLFGCASFINAQHTLIDTVLLEEVIHYGELKKYQSGAKTQKIDPVSLQIAQEGGIENVLKRFAPIYIKSNAGGMSTIRFRGTSPNHTTINFGGINLNLLTLGHSNLSSIPSFLFDGLTLQYGSSSAVNGSGAVGGAVYLDLNQEWTKGMKFDLRSSIGSFGEYLNGVKVFAGNGKWESVSRLYLFSKKNNFSFTNIYTDDIDNPVVRDIQKGAEIKNVGILQELNYRFSEKEFFRSTLWYENNWYQVQPSMKSNYRYNGTQEIDNDNVRVWSEYLNNKHDVNLKAGLGFVHDMQIYDNITTQKIGTNRLVSEITAAYDISDKLGIKSGIKYRYIKPEVYAYADSVIEYEEHLDLFMSSFYRFGSQLRATLNFRQMFVTNFDVPFTPSLGAEYIIRSGTFSYFKITTAFSGSYRIPTFNDRYWGTQGNPDLKPESGRSIELGGNFTNEQGTFRFNMGLNAFYMDVKNWIEWRNFGVWMAQNVSEVVSKGLEFQSSLSFPVGDISSDINANYTWNKVEAIKDINNNAVLNRQLIYTPEHMGNLSFKMKVGKWELLTDGQFTGSRFTDDFGHKLQPYFLLNYTAVYKLEIKNQQFLFMFSSNNVFNTGYQNEKYYAMPGRSFRLSVSYKFEKLKL